MSQKEANLISFKVLLTRENKIVTELSMLPENEVDNVLSTNPAQSDKDPIRTIAQIPSQIKNCPNPMTIISHSILPMKVLATKRSSSIERSFWLSKVN